MPTATVRSGGETRGRRATPCRHGRGRAACLRRACFPDALSSRVGRRAHVQICVERLPIVPGLASGDGSEGDLGGAERDRCDVRRPREASTAAARTAAIVGSSAARRRASSEASVTDPALLGVLPAVVQATTEHPQVVPSAEALLHGSLALGGRFELPQPESGEVLGQVARSPDCPAVAVERVVVSALERAGEVGFGAPAGDRDALRRGGPLAVIETGRLSVRGRGSLARRRRARCRGRRGRPASPSAPRAPSRRPARGDRDARPAREAVDRPRAGAATTAFAPSRATCERGPSFPERSPWRTTAGARRGDRGGPRGRRA